MSLVLTGTIQKKLPVQKGESARGEWQKQEFVILTTNDPYPKNICFNVWGEEKVRELESYKEGEEIKVSFNIKSREYQERWYTDIEAWRIERVGAVTATPATPSMDDLPPAGGEEIDLGDSEEDLPF